MAKRVKIPDSAEYRAAWAKMGREDRKRIMRAVNFVRPLDKRNEAAMAVAVARGQQRFWRFAWIAGPIIAAALQWRQEAEVIIANIIIATVIFGVLAVVFRRRAKRAEALNLAVVEGGKKKGSSAQGDSNPKAGKKRKGRS